jgi:hypothetical protein
MSAPIYEGTTPLVSDRYIITLTAGEDLAVGVVVELTADWTVKKPTAVNSLKNVGITLTSAKSGGKVTVVCRGICRATAYGNIAVGDQVTNAPANAPGSVTTDNSNKNTSILGQALAAASSGGTAYILLW